MNRFLVVAAMLCLVLSASAFAQTTNGTLGGTVSDATGALIPGVTVTITNTATGIVNTSLTNESGAYQFASLQTGTYKLAAELSGFQSQVVNNFSMGLGQQARQNFILQVGAQSQLVEVSVDANTELKTTTASVGTVLPQVTLQDLPLGSRNVQNLIALSAGTGPQGDDGGIYGNFAGGRVSAVNVTRDGFVNSDGRYTHGEFSESYTSPDLVEEVKIITANVDAENTRGSGQVQMVTRSGSNAFKGSAVYTNRNSKLDSNTWFNNLNGVKPNWENRNQFAFRIGGPVIKNKTFFFVLVDEQRDATRSNVTGTVLTPMARQGIYRFFPGADNANALAADPTVDRLGNPVKPSKATGDLSAVDLFGNCTFNGAVVPRCVSVRDPLRATMDPTGFVQKVRLANMPLPNDYTGGDGLNTAAIKFTNRVYGTDVADGNSNDQNNRDQLNLRVDHNFNSKNKLSGVWTYENSHDHSGQAGLRSYPGGFDGVHTKWPRLYTLSLVSTLSQSMVNEVRFGLRRSAIASQAPFYAGRALDGSGPPTTTEDGKKAYALLPQNNGIPFQVGTSFFGDNGFMNWTAGFGSTRTSRSPLWQYGDNFSFNMGKHSFKAGIEFRRDQTTGWNDNDMTPHVTFGAGNSAVTGIDGTTVPGLSANSQTAVRSLLTDMAGSVSQVTEGFDLPNATATTFLGYKDGYVLHDRDWHSNEASIFFKDDWKIGPALTMNLGIHWEYFGAPYEGKGRAGLAIGATNEIGACGISCGALTLVQFVGKNSPHPNLQLYKDDYNNFAPSVGFSYSLPWFGKDKTIVRMGYGWSYTGGALKSANTILDSIAGGTGTVEISGGGGITYKPSGYTNLANLTLPIPQQFAPLTAIPIDGSRSDSLSIYSTNRVNAYIQNFNFEIQRELTKTLTLDVAYVGSKSTKLPGGRNLNAVNIGGVLAGETFLQAFIETRAGLNAPFFDALLKGVTINASGTASGPVNGTTVRGSDALRQSTTFRTAIANGAVGTLANSIETSTLNGGKGGGLYSANAPQNFFVLNPQFASVNYYDNSAAANYHSMQVQVSKRLSHGLTSQFTYTLSKTIDLTDGDGTTSPRDPNNANLEKGVAGFDRRHTLTDTATFELPFGKGRMFLNNGPQWVQRLTDRWQLGGIFSWGTGSPLSFTGNAGTLYQGGTSYPNLVGTIPQTKLTFLANGVSYFNQADFTLPKDPACLNSAVVTTLNSTSTSCTGLALADGSGKLIMTNPGPGTYGNLGKGVLVGPSNVGLDVNVIKRVKMTENKDFEFRVDCVNVLNHPNFGNPTLSINSTQFGRITSASGNRRFTFNARVNF